MYYKGVYCMMRSQPRDERFGLPIGQQIDHVMLFQIDEDGAVAPPLFPGSGKGSNVAITPSPKNRTGKFLYIRLKPFVPPV
jgi:hypothetical protein